MYCEQLQFRDDPRYCSRLLWQRSVAFYAEGKMPTTR